MSTVQIWRTSGGRLVLARGDEAWTSVTDFPWLARESAIDWSAGEWLPNEGDGWERVPGSWLAEVWRDDVAAGDRPRLLAEITGAEGPLVDEAIWSGVSVLDAAAGLARLADAADEKNAEWGER